MTLRNVLSLNFLKHYHWQRAGLQQISRATMSTNPVITKQKISDLLSLRTVSEHPDPKARSLVIFFPWLYASSSAIDKYCNLYHARGLDVLSISCQLKHFLWPKSSQTVANELLDYLSKVDRDNFLVHSMSVGAFVYTVVMMQMLENEKKGNVVRCKIHAHVFDSLTMGSLEEMVQGVSQRTQNPLGQALIRGGINTYFLLTNPFTVRFYDKSVDFFKNQPIHVPTLVYYSRNDTMCSSQAMEDMIILWKEMGLNPDVVWWETSMHAGHYMKHPERYSNALNSLIDNFLEPKTPKANL